MATTSIAPAEPAARAASATPVASVASTVSVASARLDWVVRSAAPPGWPEALNVCGGGFFHSPLGLLTGAPAGEPVFVDLWRDNELAGIAVGVRHGCRLSARRSHVYFPTLPAMRDARLREAGLAALCDAMRAEAADDITMDSFDASWAPRTSGVAVSRAERNEYVVKLGGLSGAEVPSRFTGNHRRHCAKGARRGWTMRPAQGADGAELLRRVQGTAVERASLRGDEFEVEPLPSSVLEGSPDDRPWGMTTFAAWDDDMLLTAIAVGWANGRTYYVSGGSTPRGYAQGSAAWLHWRVMHHFASRGFTEYNLGGTPASAMLETDPAYGLQRFKTGFGATAIALRSLKWEFETVHVMGHRVKHWASRRYEAWSR
jgi:hypothetical protein